MEKYLKILFLRGIKKAKGGGDYWADSNGVKLTYFNWQLGQPSNNVNGDRFIILERYVDSICYKTKSRILARIVDSGKM